MPEFNQGEGEGLMRQTQQGVEQTGRQPEVVTRDLGELLELQRTLLTALSDIKRVAGEASPQELENMMGVADPRKPEEVANERRDTLKALLKLVVAQKRALDDVENQISQISPDLKLIE